MTEIAVDESVISKGQFDQLFRPAVKGCVNMLGKPMQKSPVRYVKFVGYMTEVGIKVTAKHNKQHLQSWLNNSGR